MNREIERRFRLRNDSWRAQSTGSAARRGGPVR
jgi:CYTH domain-containing protein